MEGKFFKFKNRLLLTRIQCEENLDQCIDYTECNKTLFSLIDKRALWVFYFFSAALEYVLCSWKPAVIPLPSTPKETETCFFST